MNLTRAILIVLTRWNQSCASLITNVVAAQALVDEHQRSLTYTELRELVRADEIGRAALMRAIRLLRGSTMPIDLPTAQTILQRHFEAAMQEMAKAAETPTPKPPAAPPPITPPPAASTVDVLYIGDALPRQQIADLMRTVGLSTAFGAMTSIPAVKPQRAIVVMTAKQTDIESIRAKFPSVWPVWAVPQSSMAAAVNAYRAPLGVGWIDLQADTSSRLDDAMVLATALTAPWTGVMPAPKAGGGIVTPAGTAYAQMAVDDMVKPHDGVIAGAPKDKGWVKSANNIQGNRPRWDSAPDYWKQSFPNFFRDAWWTHLIPWLVVAPLDGNAATQSVVRLANLRSYVLTGNAWQLHQQVDSMGGEVYSPAGLMHADGLGGWSGGTVKALQPGLVAHGWGGPKQMPDPSAIRGVHTSVDFWIEGSDADRASLAVSVGADFYPTGASIPEGTYVPAVGGSRFKRGTKTKQTITMTSLRDGGVHQEGQGNGLTVAEWLANPVRP